MSFNFFMHATHLPYHMCKVQYTAPALPFYLVVLWLSTHSSGAPFSSAALVPPFALRRLSRALLSLLCVSLCVCVCVCVCVQASATIPGGHLCIDCPVLRVRT